MEGTVLLSLRQRNRPQRHALHLTLRLLSKKKRLAQWMIELASSEKQESMLFRLRSIIVVNFAYP